MKGADPDPAARHQRIDALAHLIGALAGDGDTENGGWSDALFQQPGDPASDDTRLAAAGAGEDEQWPVNVHHGLALGGRQIGEKGLFAFLRHRSATSAMSG